MNQEKIADLKNWMHQEKIDFTYISDPGHIAYFSGYESEPHERVLALLSLRTTNHFYLHLHWKSKMPKRVVGLILFMVI